MNEELVNHSIRTELLTIELKQRNPQLNHLLIHIVQIANHCKHSKAAIFMIQVLSFFEVLINFCTDGNHQPCCWKRIRYFLAILFFICYKIYELSNMDTPGTSVCLILFTYFVDNCWFPLSPIEALHSQKFTCSASDMITTYYVMW